MLSSTPLSRGVTEPDLLLLERDGVRAHGVFHDVDIDRDRVRMADGSFHMHLRDSWRSHVAAYELGRLLGLDNIPPAVPRAVDGPGSVTMYVEDGELEVERRARGVSFLDTLEGRRRGWDGAFLA